VKLTSDTKLYAEAGIEQAQYMQPLLSLVMWLVAYFIIYEKGVVGLRKHLVTHLSDLIDL
jgi:hypothetical protein